MQVEITVDGVTSLLDIDLGLDRFTLLESVRLEDALPADQFAAIMENDGEIAPTPRMLQAMLWAKLATQFPGLGLEDFDLDLSELMESMVDTSPTIVLPMTTGDDTVNAEVEVQAQSFG